MSYVAANILGAGALLLGLIYAWFLTGDFEQTAARNYPYAVITFTAVMTTMWLWRTINRKRVGESSDTDDETAGLGTLGGYLVLAGTLVYGTLVVYFGYVVPTLIYIAVVSRFLGGRNWPLIGAVAVLFPFAIYFFLVYGFDRPLPF